jgi:hypothetical protein
MNLRMTTPLYFVTSLIGACGAVAVGAIWPPIRKHLLWYLGSAVGIATGLAMARHFFLGTNFLLVVMIIFGSVGGAIGNLVGRFLEIKLTASAHNQQSRIT